MSWTINNGIESKTLAEWGVASMAGQFINQGVDQVTFEAVVDRMDADTAFAFGNTLKIYDPDGVKWFEGTVIQTPLTARPDSEAQGYIVAGPWWNLEENIYKQPWISNGVTTVYTGHLLLNSSTTGLLTVADQIGLILDYLISLYPGAEPFQKGIIEPDALPPISEINGYSCAAALRSQLRWVPEGVTWFDYTTTPPTLHIRARANLAAVNLTVANKDTVRLVPRYDLQRPSVHLQFERTSVINGKNFLQVIDDVFPLDKTGQEPRALSIPLNLAGPTTVASSAEIVSEVINPNLVAWWKRHHEPLRDPRIKDISIVSWIGKVIDEDTGELIDSSAYDFELVEGQITDWMDYAWEQEIIKGVLSYKIYDRDATDPNAKLVENRTEDLVTINLVATEAATGVYQNVTTEDTGDPIPVGLAQYLYEQLSELHFDGSILLAEQEASGQVKIGNVINITDGRAEWATMRGLVQSVGVDVERGETTLTIGPPSHLGVADLMELLRVGRRFRWTPSATQTTGEIGEAGKFSLGQPTANTNTHNNGPTRSQLAIVSTDKKSEIFPEKMTIENGARSATVSINTDDLPEGLTASFQATKICVTNPDGSKSEKDVYLLRTSPQ